MKNCKTKPPIKVDNTHLKMIVVRCVPLENNNGVNMNEKSEDGPNDSLQKQLRNELPGRQNLEFEFEEKEYSILANPVPGQHRFNILSQRKSKGGEGYYECSTYFYVKDNLIFKRLQRDDKDVFKKEAKVHEDVFRDFLEKKTDINISDKKIELI